MSIRQKKNRQLVPVSQKPTEFRSYIILRNSAVVYPFLKSTIFLWYYGDNWIIG